MSNLYYKYFHYIHETRVPAFLRFSDMRYIQVNLFVFFFFLVFSVSPTLFLPFKSIVCVWSEVAGQSVFVPCDLSSFKVSWLWSSQT